VFFYNVDLFVLSQVHLPTFRIVS